MRAPPAPAAADRRPTPPTAGGPGVPNTPNGQTFLAGRPAPGQSYDGSASRVQISADGNWVVYHHGSENLNMVNRPAAGCPKPAQTNTQIYRTNLLNGVTELVSVGVDGCYANDESSFPDVSGDGRFVVYMSKATNVVVPDGNGAQQDIFLKDMATGGTTVVNVTTAGGAATGGSSSRPDISDDASTLAYSSDATNLVPGDNNGQGDCFVTKRANLRGPTVGQPEQRRPATERLQLPLPAHGQRLGHGLRLLRLQRDRRQRDAPVASASTSVTSAPTRPRW